MSVVSLLVLCCHVCDQSLHVDVCVMSVVDLPVLTCGVMSVVSLPVLTCVMSVASLPVLTCVVMSVVSLLVLTCVVSHFCGQVSRSLAPC